MPRIRKAMGESSYGRSQKRQKVKTNLSAHGSHLVRYLYQEYLRALFDEGLKFGSTERAVSYIDHALLVSPISKYGANGYFAYLLELMAAAE
jgi:hypothetical protein